MKLYQVARIDRRTGDEFDEYFGFDPVEAIQVKRKTAFDKKEWRLEARIWDIAEDTDTSDVMAISEAITESIGYDLMDCANRKIYLGEKEITADEFVRHEILTNKGTQNFATKNELIELCDANGISIEGKETKPILYDLLIDNGVSPKDLADRFGVGVSSQIYQHTFDI